MTYFSHRLTICKQAHLIERSCKDHVCYWHKADIGTCRRHVRSSPKATIGWP